MPSTGWTYPNSVSQTGSGQEWTNPSRIADEQRIRCVSPPATSTNTIVSIYNTESVPSDVEVYEVKARIDGSVRPPAADSLENLFFGAYLEIDSQTHPSVTYTPAASRKVRRRIIGQGLIDTNDIILPEELQGDRAKLNFAAINNTSDRTHTFLLRRMRLNFLYRAFDGLFPNKVIDEFSLLAFRSPHDGSGGSDDTVARWAAPMRIKSSFETSEDSTSLDAIIAELASQGVPSERVVSSANVNIYYVSNEEFVEYFDPWTLPLPPSSYAGVAGYTWNESFEIDQATIVVSNAYDSSVRASTTRHELLHAIGFSHSLKPNSNIYGGYVGQSRLSVLDRTVIRALYDSGIEAGTSKDDALNYLSGISLRRPARRFGIRGKTVCACSLNCCTGGLCLEQHAHLLPLLANKQFYL